MQTLERLAASDVAAVMVAYGDALRLHQERINRLNVFPVPDGDTGTNMALTVQSVVEGLPSTGADLATVAKAISHGSLMGARGNSGVILSQILRGLADAFREAESVDGAALAAGLRRAADGAWRSVHDPVEGTILSVAQAAADGAGEAPGAGLVAVAEAAREAAAAALARTPEQLPALAAAGVVDSGGSGLLLLLDALLQVTAGAPIPEPEAGGVPVETPRLAGEARAEQGCRYEVMYFLDAPDEAVPAFRAVWAGLGESIVVVGGEGTYNCHIHTDDVGAAIEAALDAGRPHSIRVSDLWDEVEEERWVREAEAASPADAGEEPRLACAVVAVCSGEGIRRIFVSLGVSRVVAGGQSMNPSTADLLAAVEEAPADAVVILPNNDNIVPVAEAAAEASSKSVRVVPTPGIPEGFAALLDYDPEGDADVNAAAMVGAAARVVSGEVTRAVRAAGSDAGPIAAGDYLGIARDGIRSVAPTLAAAATGLLGQLIDRAHHEIVTVIAGEGATPADTRRITTWLEEHHPDVEVEVHPGGQPLYPYLFSVE